MNATNISRYLVVILLIASAAHGDLSDVIDIPQLADIVIDGQAEDWSAGGFRVDMMPNENGHVRAAADYDFRFRIGWDSRGLLLLVKVRDDVFEEDGQPYLIWADDMMGVYVGESVGSDNRYQVVFAGGMTRFLTKPTGFVYDERIASPAPNGKVSYSIARTKTDGGFIMEILLPWSNLGISPEPGRQIGVQIFAGDVDRTPPRRHYALWYPSLKTGKDPSKMHRVRLADKPSPTKLAVAGGARAGWLPRVRATGPVELVGQKVQVLRDGVLLASGVLGEDDGRAMVELRLPYSPADTAYTGLAVQVDGKHAATLSLPKVGPPKLGLFPMPTDADRATPITVRVLSPDTITTPAAVTLRAFSADGNLAESVEFIMGEVAKLKLSPGVYRIEADVPDFFGHRLRASGACAAGADPAALLGELVARARKMSDDPARAATAGWLDYLATRVDTEVIQPGKTQVAPLLTIAYRLDQWLSRLDTNPEAWRDLRGGHEWAYLAKADGTGQPFTIWIPDDYAPAKSYPLGVNLHGATNTHQVFDPLKRHKHPSGNFQIRVMGRARSAGYGALAETDIIEAIEYVKARWNIDPDRVHLWGNSMGGYGTFSMSTRYPHMFASARALCGPGIHVPIGNLNNLPLATLHSRDDPLVPAMASRAVVRFLAGQGYPTFMLETDGFGHGVGSWKKGMRQARKWAQAQRRPRQVRHVRYEALDESARRGYWIEVAEWGPLGIPAKLEARIAPDNSLYLSLDNVKVAKIDLRNSPIDMQHDLRVFVDGEYVSTAEAPLAKALFVSRRETGWSVDTNAPKLPAERLHFPGGAMALYHGEPIMIVWGTGGDDATNRAMLTAANAARRSAKPSWPTPKALAATLFGRLPGKADTDVTDKDMDKYNLVLIGTAEQNSVVAKLANKLPVRLEGGKFVSNDGESWSADDRAIGLLYYNPLAPKRLIYWTASQSPRYYRPKSPLTYLQAQQWSPPDMVIMGYGKPTIVAARRFDSRWNWEEAGYFDSPLLSEAQCTPAGMAETFAAAVRKQTGAELGAGRLRKTKGAPAYAAGETRVADVLGWEYFGYMATMELPGSAILACNKKTIARSAYSVRILPADNIDSASKYRVAIPLSDVRLFHKQTGHYADNLQILRTTVREALQKYLHGE